MPLLIGWEVNGVGRRDGCLLGGGEGVRGGVVFAFLLCRLEGRGRCGFRGFLGLSLQGGISLDLLPKARVLLSQHLHLIRAAFLQICQLLLHLRLAVQDGDEVRGDASRSRGTSIRLLVRSSFVDGGNHLWRKTGTKGVRLVPYGGRQLFLQRTNKMS